jgi:hypothetical protein
MKVVLKITSALLKEIRSDLARPHAFAHERVGFVSVGLSSLGDDVLMLPRAYRAVEDEDYLRDASVGAMMGPHAIRKVLQWALQEGHGMLHVHTHCGRGIPGFSGVDIRENAKFVPDFLKVAPQCVHGALVLSDEAVRGQVWFDRKGAAHPVDTFIEVGPTLRKWRPT